MYLTGVLLLLLAAKIFSYNIDTNHFIVYVDPNRNNNNISSSYFGYSVLLYPGDKNGMGKWVKIGAPKGQDPTLKKYPNSGVVYDCPLMEPCSPLDIKQGYLNKGESLNGSWLGGSMDINYKFQRIVICGFRTIEIYETGRDMHYDLIGACYSSLINTSFTDISPMKGNPFITNKQYPHSVFFYGQGQAGFSVHLPENENSLILGVPGVYNWAGSLVKVEYRESSDGPIASRLRTRSRRDIVQNMYVADPLAYKFSFQYELFGYSATSGHYYGGKNLYYVGTAPKYLNYDGKASIVRFNGNKALIEKTSLIGSQFGEYFGASSTSGDLNSDGFDDLIIGAPYHVTKTYNEGATYIFLGRSQGQLDIQHTLYGQKTNGQFGTSLMFLGDINNDGFGDLAVGAPYEEDFSGVLYIFRGNREGIEKLPCQRIVGKHISPEIRGFGISISRPADIDANGYNDLLVGAYISGNAVLLRTNPIVVVTYNMRPIPKELKQTTKEFLIYICFKYTHFQNSSLELTRSLKVDEILSRAILKNVQDAVKNIAILGHNKEHCESVTILLKDKIKNYVAPITFSLTYNLVKHETKKEVLYISEKYKKGENNFCVRCPVLDEYRSRQASSIDIPFTLDCGDDNICQSKLTFDASFMNLRQDGKYVVGSANYLDLKTTITNLGEHSYSTKLEVTLPQLITFRQIPPECSEQNISVIMCNVDTILTNNKKTVVLNLDMKKVNKDNVKTELSVFLKVLTSSRNSNPNKKTVTLSLEREAYIQMTGKSEQQSVPFGKEIDKNPVFTQTYQVEKIGVSPIEKVLFNITIPHSVTTYSGTVSFIRIYEPDIIFAGQRVMCTSNINYIDESKPVGVQEALNSDGILLRRRRQVEVFKDVKGEKKEDIIIDGKEHYLTPHRTSYWNCSTKDVECSTIHCSIGPFEQKNTLVDINIKMMLDLSMASHLFQEKDFVVYATEGIAMIQIPSQLILPGNRSDFKEVSSIFINESIRTSKVALWIIILAIILGILLLALIIYGLTKAGFFKRADKEKLKSLKAEHAQEVGAQANPEALDGGSSTEVEEEPPMNTCEGLGNQDPGINASTEGLVDDK